MQDLKTSQARKPWYQRAVEMVRVWKLGTLKSSETPQSPNNPRKGSKQLRKCKSLKVAANSFTRVCLCAPISPYEEVFRAYVPPRRSSSYPPTKQFQSPSLQVSEVMMNGIERGRVSADLGISRKVFRGKSLTDDVLMRRFVAEEEAMMQRRWRNEMEVIRKRRNLMRKKTKLGPSRLSIMVLAEEEEES